MATGKNITANVITTDWPHYSLTAEHEVPRFVPTVWDGSTNQCVGYRSEITAQIATNLTQGSATTICSAIFFGNWSDLLVASFGSTDVTVDNVTLAGNRVVKIYTDRYCDIALRHPASMAVLGGVLTN